MPRGMPDWAEYSPQDMFNRSLDNAELAVRLGSPTIYDRSGTVIFQDDFGAGDGKWEKVVDSNCWIQPSFDNGFVGGYSLMFYDKGVADALPALWIKIPFMIQTKIGVEGAFCLTDSYSRCGLNCNITYQGYTNLFYLLYNRQTRELQIMKDDGNYITIASNLYVDVERYSWFVMKLIVNPITLKYEKVRFNNLVIPLTNYSCYRYTTSEVDSLSIGFHLGATTTIPVKNYLGYAIVTANE